MEEEVFEDLLARQNRVAPQETQPAAVEIQCGCKSHPKHKLLDIEAPLDVDSFFNGFFMSQNDALVKLAHSRRETDDVAFGSWKNDGKHELGARELRYTVKYKTPFSLFTQTSRVFEKQTILRRDPEKAYVVSTTVSTPDVPGGESFTSIMRYCFVAVDGTKSILRTTAGVKFSRRLMFGKKIESMSVEGSRTFINHINSILKEFEFNLEELSLVEKRKTEELSLERKVSMLEDSMRRSSFKYSPEDMGSPMQGQLEEGPRRWPTSFDEFGARIGPSLRCAIAGFINGFFNPQVLVYILAAFCAVAAIYNLIASIKVTRNLNSINSLISSLPAKGGK